MTAARIDALLSEHAEQVLGISRSGIADGNATFETQAPDRSASAGRRRQPPSDTASWRRWKSKCRVG